MSDRKTGRNADGTFGPGNSGKHKGTRHKATQAALTLLDGEAEGLTRKAIELDLKGDTTAIYTESAADPADELTCPGQGIIGSPIGLHDDGRGRWRHGIVIPPNARVIANNDILVVSRRVRAIVPALLSEHVELVIHTDDVSNNAVGEFVRARLVDERVFNCSDSP